jgi:hypothetical protein
MIGTNEKILGCFHGENLESKGELVMIPFVKADQFSCVIAESGIFINAERHKDVSGVEYLVKSGHYTWDVIKLLELQNKVKRPSLKMQFADGNELKVEIDVIDEQTRNLLLLKQRQPDTNDEAFKKNKEQTDKSRRINTIIGCIVALGFLFLIAVLIRC